MKRFLSLPVLAACALLGASCSQQVKPVKKAPRPPVYVGKVEQVYPSHNYVLIALAGNVYEPGTVLISQSPGLEENRRVANLVVTEERLGRARIPADIRSGAVEAGDLVFLYRNLAAPESSGKKDDQDPDNPAPKPDEDNKDITPPITPDSGKTPDGLLPMPGEAPVPDSAEQERISREREKILRELDNIPGRLDDPWREAFSGKSAGK
ncbi:hypothetical protein [Akkermansia muciniphila]|uniref:hypothetical protein n=1 Tax=Akkermansia muciniphila TaxID=239935 RepID=UPI000C9A8EBA|nr:hypothetical protein [Akkermansia muciniphila]PNC05803.1 hypothetical protein CXU21_01760 [Akkermansia muciniphila]